MRLSRPPVRTCLCFRGRAAELHARIDARVEQMFAAGLVEEVRGLLAKYGKLSRTAMQAVGYREVIEYLEIDHPQALGTQYSVLSTPHKAAEPRQTSHNDSLSQCIDRVKASTRQFARRQETWFRSLGECQFVAMHEHFDPALVAAGILSAANDA